jgi:hypothetical protein
MAEDLRQHQQEVLVSVIIPEFHHFQVKLELRLGDAVELDQTSLGERSEALKAVQIDLPARISLLVINPPMSIAANYQGIITVELVHVGDGAVPDRLKRQIQQRSGRNILDNIDLNHPVSLKKTQRPAPYEGRAGRPFLCSSHQNTIHLFRYRPAATTCPSDRRPEQIDGSMRQLSRRLDN